MKQNSIPFMFFRGGTSRGPYFRSDDLPQDRDKLSEVLIAVIGAGNIRNIDGLGGGSSVTTKVAILSKSTEPDADVEYLFAQVGVDKKLVDFGPTCGNILVGVGPAALEMGLVPTTGDKTKVRIRATNTNALVESVIETPGGVVNYEGNVAIDGVPGKSSPVALNFLNIVGSKTGKMFPTGNKIDIIQGIPVTCIDVAMPMMIARAEDFGISGYESAQELDENKELFSRMEAIRIEAGQMMGMGDVRAQVTPKIGLVSKARNNGHFSSRYFMPWNAHPSMAITGSQCLAACYLAPGTVSDDLRKNTEGSSLEMVIEHPLGEMKIMVTYDYKDGELDFHSAGVVRTARLIAEGNVFIPRTISVN